MISKLNKLLKPAGIALGLLTLTACSTTTPVADSTSSDAAVTTADLKQDKGAILAMAGTYKVTFHFEETVSFKEGYELKTPKDSGGYETVYVIQNDPGFISLQHILVVGKDKQFPVKHWRQDWIYEPEYIYEFVGFNSWRKKVLSEEERRGKWAQVVYQVDDSPRYAALGTWEHKYGVSSWAGRNLRPLPRRDMTTRDDYDALDITNRHAITFEGWVHEQDNTKLVLRGDKPVAITREIGVNTYKSFDDYNLAIADDYWAATKDYWAGVRATWTALEEKNDAFGLTLQGEPQDLYSDLLDLATEVEEGEKETAVAITEAGKVIENYTTTDIETSIKEAKASFVEREKSDY